MQVHPMASERPVFDLSQFEVERPKGFVETQKIEDRDEEGDGRMKDFRFESDYVMDADDIIKPTAKTEANLKAKKEKGKTSADASNNEFYANQTLMDLASQRALTEGLTTTIQEKIEKFRAKWKRREAKNMRRDPKLRAEAQKWEKTMTKMIKAHKEQERKDREDVEDPKYNDCGDRSCDFAQLGVSRILIQGINQHLNWKHPTPVQRETIPLALAAHDLLINAITGSGKSGAFIIPTIQRLMFSETNELNERRVLVIGPTRELAIQIHGVFKVFVEYLKSLKGKNKFTLSLCIPIIGGVRAEVQHEFINTHRCDILVATPGRLVDLMHNYFNEARNEGQLLYNVEILVLDEADRLLDMGFQPQLFEIFKHLSSKEYRQSMLCSATLSDEVLKLVDMTLNTTKLKKVAVDPQLALNTGKLTQEFIRLHAGQEKYKKAMVFALLLTSYRDKKTIIFCRRKDQAHIMRVAGGFFGLKCAELHGNMSQFQRLKSLEQFKADDSIKFLFCTDVAARGIDINNVELIINQEFPTNVKTYIHRVGRTARAGRCGYACTFVSDSRKKVLKKLIMSNANRTGVMRSRTMNHEFVLWVQSRIEDMFNELKPLLAVETKERGLRIMALKLEKAGNLLKHQGTIKKREKRTWVTKDEDKKALRRAAMKADLGAEETKKMLTKDERIQKAKEKKAHDFRMAMLRSAESARKIARKVRDVKKKDRNEKNKRKIGNDKVDVDGDALDMIRNPRKYRDGSTSLGDKRLRAYMGSDRNRGLKKRFRVKKGDEGEQPQKLNNNKKFRKKKKRHMIGKRRRRQGK